MRQTIIPFIQAGEITREVDGEENKPSKKVVEFKICYRGITWKVTRALEYVSFTSHCARNFRATFFPGYRGMNLHASFLLDLREVHRIIWGRGAGETHAQR